MDDYSQELSDFSKTVFDRYGCVRNKLRGLGFGPKLLQRFLSRLPVQSAIVCYLDGKIDEVLSQGSAVLHILAFLRIQTIPLVVFPHDNPPLSLEECIVLRPLHVAIEKGIPNIAENIQTLYDANPGIHPFRDSAGYTPLFIATSLHNLPAVRKLLTFNMRSCMISRIGRASHHSNMYRKGWKLS
ncbi:hypothetical protein J3R30DRAFT_3403783 [Lentinula aciculospora]|uniref:Ankyrin n=1 Tax=Lentinula aciculospora TaxID=153920 RepID=A0A9W9ADH3_9AGAR|nr:hypothetical protein J3R30DRAFT_3403783 [Lentinula aciculospora]